MSQQQQLRQRGAKDAKRPLTPNKDPATVLNGKVEESWDSLKGKANEVKNNDWDHGIAFTIITILGFLTRFWGISHPDQVVFDEVHFGKVGRVTEQDALSSIACRDTNEDN